MNVVQRAACSVFFAAETPRTFFSGSIPLRLCVASSSIRRGSCEWKGRGGSESWQGEKTKKPKKARKNEKVEKREISRKSLKNVKKVALPLTEHPADAQAHHWIGNSILYLAYSVRRQESAKKEVFWGFLEKGGPQTSTKKGGVSGARRTPLSTLTGFKMPPRMRERSLEGWEQGRVEARVLLHLGGESENEQAAVNCRAADNSPRRTIPKQQGAPHTLPLRVPGNCPDAGIVCAR